jgi:6-phosphogluconate dehydrogenase
MITKIGLIGLSTMGSNLALNFAEKGIEVVVYNRSDDKTKKLENQKNIITTYSVDDFIASLGSKKVILLLVKAGEATDSTINNLLPHIKEEDIVIDLGNANYQDSIMRSLKIKNYFVCGISGGEKGARHGASLMLSGNKSHSDDLVLLFSKVASTDFKGAATIEYLGEGIVGNIVKTVHNGIEYVQMQVLAEIYSVLRYYGGYDTLKISQTFEQWSEEKKDYLTEVMSIALKDERLIDTVLPIVESKGTGKWTAQMALKEDVYSTLISYAYNLRMLKGEVLALQQNNDISIEKLSDLYDQAYLNALEEGLSIIYKLSPSVDLKQVRRVWQGGCIIRNHLLLNDKKPDNTRFIKLFSPLRNCDIPLPILSMMYQGALLDVIGSVGNPLIAIARDVFGSHGFHIKSGEIIYKEW